MKPFVFFTKLFIVPSFLICVMNQPSKRARCTPVVSSLFSCRSEKCRKSMGGITKHSQEDSNRVNVKCISCDAAWVVCISCQRRFNSTKMYLANKHFDDVHSKNTFDASVTTDIDFSSERSVDSQDSSKIIEQCLNESSMALNSRQFFQNKAISLPNAIQHLVGQAFAQSSSSSTLPTLNESTFHLKLANILSQLPTTLHFELIGLLNSSKDLEMTSTRLPLVPNDVLRFYTKHKYSLYNQLPSPTCHVSEYHAFVHLRSVIEHYIGFGYHMDDNHLSNQHRPSSTILQCPEVMSIHKKTMSNIDDSKKMSTIMLFLMIWSDDFEPSANMMNKHSTWMRTVTICANKGFGVSTEHTYLLSLGYKKDNHDEMNDMFAKELDDLSNGKWMYSGKYKRRVFVITKVLVMSADRPERNALTHLLGHGGLTTRRWKYTAFINQEKLPSCKKCCSKRLSRYIILRNNNIYKKTGVCQLCCDWNYQSQSHYMKIDIPDKYPRTQHPTSPIPPISREVVNIQHLVPAEQTFEWLREGCRFCFHNVYHQVWNLGTSDEYMRCLGLSQSFNRKYVVEKARELYAKNPNHPNPSSTMMFPPLWDTHTELKHFIDLPMHLLFLGIIKSTIDWTFDWLKLHKSLTAFGNHIESYHVHIKQLQCDFCKLESFTNGQEISTSGWRAESHLAFARIMTYSFSFIRDLIPNKDEFEHEIMSFELLHNTCLCMIARLMTPQIVSKSELEDYIKIFLSILDLGERLTFTESLSGMFWFQRSNFLCLLNLPEQIEQFGDIRKYWEGSRERFIQEIKPLMKATRETTSYLKIQLEKLNKNQLMRNLYKEVQIDTERSSYTRFKRFIVYDNIEAVRNKLHDGNALSLLKESQFNNGTVYVAIKGTNGICLHKLFFDDRNGETVYHMFYARVSVDRNIYLTYTQMKDIDFAVFCPCLGLSRDLLDDNQQSKRYACIGSDWLYRIKGGSFTLPTLSSSIEQYINEFM